MSDRSRIWAYTAIGNAMLAFAVCAIVIPKGIMMGGVNGLALAVQYFVPVRLSVLTGCLSAGLFLLGWKALGRQFAAKSFVSTLIYPVIMAIFESLPVERIFAGEDMIVCTIACSVLVGMGVGLVVRAGGASGGDDALALVIAKRTGWPVSRAYLITDLTVLALSLSYIPVGNIACSVVTVTLSSFIVGKIHTMGRKDETH